MADVPVDTALAEALRRYRTGDLTFTRLLRTLDDLASVQARSPDTLTEAAQRVLARYRPHIYEFSGNGEHSELHDLARALASAGQPTNENERT